MGKAKIKASLIKMLDTNLAAYKTLRYLSCLVSILPNFKKALFEIVYDSRIGEDEQMEFDPDQPFPSTPASKAITILNMARVSFSGMDLSRI